MAPIELTRLTQQLQEAVSNFESGNESHRQELLSLSKELNSALETPSERIARMVYIEPFLYVATRVLIDLSIFRILSKADGPIKVADLAKAVGADHTLLSRLLKHINSQHFVRETGADEYEANEITRLIASPEGQGVILDMFQFFRINSQLPSFLKESSYANPTDKDATAWKYGMGVDEHYFDYISQPGREQLLESFHGHMRFKTLGLKWFEMPSLVSHLFGDLEMSKENVLIVDVGGSTGLDLQNFHAAHPSLRGRLILQDLPSTISALDTAALKSRGIEAQPHDFFTPEPVPNARAYYLKMILHDWPDVQCRQILANLRSAMKPGYSRILLNEIVVPETGAGWFETSVDMIMMGVHSAQERRERQWRELVEGVEGLRVSKIWDVDGAVEKVVEIEAV